VVLFAGAAMQKCEIVAKGVRKLNWAGAGFEGCRFEGRFEASQFGPDERWPGFLEDCDFSACTLIDCYFRDVPALELKLPKWPHVIFLDPLENADALRDLAAQLPELSLLVGVLVGRPAAVTVEVTTAEQLAKFGVPPAKLKQLIERADPAVVRC
jgi:hypothetical protein